MGIKVLVVDDSALMRKKISELLAQAGGFVVKTAKNGVEAIALNNEFAPDVITLDINMPEMDGLTALAELMLQRPVPVVMLSSLTAKGALTTLEALALGAVDYLAKPDGTISLSLELIEQELLAKIRAAAKARLKRAGPKAKSDLAGEPKRGPVAETAEPAKRKQRTSDALPLAGHLTEAGRRPQESQAYESSKRARVAATVSGSTGDAIASAADEITGLVLIGVSTGGPGTLEVILSGLPADFPYPVVIAQHMPAAFTGPFAQRLNQLCALEVLEVSQLLRLETGKVYIARGGADVVLVNRQGALHLQPRPEDLQFRWHPSVELLGRSALECCHADGLIAVMLTGMGNDGAEAFSRIRANGGRTIAESEPSAVVFGMPKELIERHGASLVLPADKIAQQLLHWASS